MLILRTISWFSSALCLRLTVGDLLKIFVFGGGFLCTIPSKIYSKTCFVPSDMSVKWWFVQVYKILFISSGFMFWSGRFRVPGYHKGSIYMNEFTLFVQYWKRLLGGFNLAASCFRVFWTMILLACSWCPYVRPGVCFGKALFITKASFGRAKLEFLFTKIGVG